ncbi:HAD family hydrolase [Paenibacillus yanchengensis]|uniref:HAD family hydrolase n=1 Tax=Paenibacillus yanchengensis TaxID=2035833 RepID=A0ABW4YMT6_9BACL
MKVVVFDLDDTLYDELTYVRSGFRAVANSLAVRYGADANELSELMWNTMISKGRGKVFDVALASIQQLTKENVKYCVIVYRKHEPEKLELFEDAQIMLGRLEAHQVPRYIVTDGNKLVQYRKIKALQLEERVNKYFITHRFGLKHSKPSPYCFNKIAQLEGVEPSDIVYVGDNIAKDFVGIKELGFQTVRILRGSYISLERSEEYHAHHDIHSLLELSKIYSL